MQGFTITAFHLYRPTQIYFLASADLWKSFQVVNYWTFVFYLIYQKGEHTLLSIKLVATLLVLLAGVGGGALAQRLSRAKVS